MTTVQLHREAGRKESSWQVNVSVIMAGITGFLGACLTVRAIIRENHDIAVIYAATATLGIATVALAIVIHRATRRVLCAIRAHSAEVILEQQRDRRGRR